MFLLSGRKRERREGKRREVEKHRYLAYERVRMHAVFQIKNTPRQKKKKKGGGMAVGGRKNSHTGCFSRSRNSWPVLGEQRTN